MTDGGAALTQLGLALIIGLSIGWARRAANSTLSVQKTCAAILGAVALSALYEALHRPTFLSATVDAVLLPLIGALLALLVAELVERRT